MDFIEFLRIAGAAICFLIVAGILIDTNVAQR